MNNGKRYNLLFHPKTKKAKKIFKIIGLVLTPIGFICMIVGFVDFFVAFGTFGVPKLFFLCFVGIILSGIGGSCLRAGYLKETAAYISSEVSPVAAETANYMAEQTGESISRIIHGNNTKYCPYCGEKNESSARYCNKCGRELTKVCPNCQKANSLTAQYCDGCGSKLD